MTVCVHRESHPVMLTFFRDLYTSYGKTVVIDLELSLIVLGKIGSIGFAATALSSKLVSVTRHCSIL